MIAVNNQTKAKIDLILVKKIANKFLKHYRLANYKVSIAFVSENTIQGLNKKYRGQDKITDVLSFPGDSKDLGEVIICYSAVKRQAKQYSDSIKDELIFILIHSLLHLIGHEDKTAKGRQKMEKLGHELAQLWGHCTINWLNILRICKFVIRFVGL